MSMTATQAQQLYVAYFNRPADTLGLAYWTGKPAAQASAAFASSAEYAATYAGMGTAARVDAIYTNLFGRSAEPAGIAYWGGLIENGKISISDAVTQIAGGAQGTDLAAYNNKVTAATAFTAALDTTAEIVAYSGTAANAAAKTWLSGITTDATLTAATTTTALNTSIAGVVTTGASTGGQSFTLTDKLDTVAGTSGNDTILADQATSSAGDQVNGGAGTDTFKLYTTGAVVLPTVSNVESIFIQGANVGVDTSVLSGVASLELANYDLTAARSVKVADGTSVTISKTTGTANAITLTNNTATSQNLVVSMSGDSTNAIDLDVDGDKVATLNVQATGESFINLVNTGALMKTVNISGSADLTVENVAVATTIAITNSAKTSVDSAVAKVKITGGAGAETVTLDHATATAREFSVSTGAGNDKIVFNTLAVAADLTDDKVTVSGGEGTDTLQMISAMAAELSGLTAANFTKKGIANDFEILAISNLAVATDDVNITRLGSNITTVDYAAGLGDAQTLQGLASGGTIILGDAARAGTDSLVVTVKDAAAAGSNADVLNIKLDDVHAGATVEYGIVNAAAVETININSTSTKKIALVTADTNDVDLIAANLVTLTITGDVYLDLGQDPLDGASLAVINASANTAGVDISVLGAAQGILITGTAKADILIGGSGADKFVTGAGDDNITGGAGADIIDISGGGSNTIIFAATSGGNGKDTITGFNVGTVASGGDVIDVTLVTFAAVTAVASLTANQTIADNALYTVNFNAAIADKDFGGTDFAELFAAAGKAFSTTIAAAAHNGVVVVQGTDTTHIYYVDASDTTLTDAMVDLVGVVSGVTNASTFVAANFA